MYTGCVLNSERDEREPLPDEKVESWLNTPRGGIRRISRRGILRNLLGIIDHVQDFADTKDPDAQLDPLADSFGAEAVNLHDGVLCLDPFVLKFRPALMP